MNTQGSLENLAIFLAGILRPLEERLQAKLFRLLFAELGLLLPPSAEAQPELLDDLSTTANNVTDLPDLVGELIAAIETENLGDIVEAASHLLGKIKDVFEAIDDIADALRALSGTFSGLSTTEVNQFANDLPQRLIDYLLVTNLERAPGVVEGLEFIQAVERTERNGISHDPAESFTYIEQRLHFDQLLAFLRNPKNHLQTLYGWDTPGFDGQLLLQRLGQILNRAGIGAIYDDTVVPPVLDILALEILSKTDITPRGLEFLIHQAFPVSTDSTFQQDDWEVDMALAGDLEAGTGIIVQPGARITYIPPSGSFDGEAFVQWKGGLADTPYFILGEPGGSLLQANELLAHAGIKFAFNSTLGQAEGEVLVVGKISDGQLFIDTSESDSFLTSILPSDVPVIDFDLELGYSSEAGFFIRSSSTLEIRLPLHLSFGPVELQGLTIGVGLSSEGPSLSLGADIKAELGPLTAVVENMGVRVTLTFTGDNSGNLGPLDLDIGYKPPAGIGLSIDGGGFKGGGLLDFEEDNQRYVGFLELQFKEKIALKALGLLTTRLPGDEPGFSLLIIITAEFSPIQLGFGFTLNGVGGLLGLNRTAKVERLRSGVKDNTLSSVLFPQDIVANADRIISDLRQVFPPQEGRFIFGPMVKIGWGSPTLITIDLGLMIEVPSPVRLLILGVVRAEIPDEEERKKKEEEEGRQIPPILKLQVNFLGVVDFDAQRLAFDASLYDSKLLTFPLSGDMAVRFSWGSDPNFLLSVGGFHPAYEPPPLALPNLQRLTLSLLGGGNPRLTMETYFAVTSNTVQFGARLELYAVKSKFNVSGFLSLDVLFQFSPFYFIADIGAMLALRIGSRSIASISLSLTLEGPTPWHVKGTAKLKICWFFTLKVRFNKTFGEERNTTLPDVEVLPLLKAALSNKGNWNARIPDGRHLLVSLNEIGTTGDQLVVQPFGVLEISQKIVPLNVSIQKFGNQLPADGNRFAIEEVRVGEPGDTETLGISDVQEQFAPAQFFEKSDVEKLSSKSFERYDAGVSVTDSERLTAAYAVKRDVEYELFYIDSQRDQRLRPWFKLFLPEVFAFNTWTTGGAIAASPLSFANNGISALAPKAVQVSQEPYAVVNVRDLTLVQNGATVSSEAGAFSLLNEMISANPALQGDIRVVPMFEVNRS